MVLASVQSALFSFTGGKKACSGFRQANACAPLMLSATSGIDAHFATSYRRKSEQTIATLHKCYIRTDLLLCENKVPWVSARLV